KSTLALDLASRLSLGSPMPDGSPGPSASAVIIFSAEDDLARVIRPRLAAAGADLSRIHTIAMPDVGGTTRDPVIRTDDIQRIESVAHAQDARLLIIDPLVAYLPPEINANNDQHMRRALAILRDLAEATRMAVVVIRHLRKSPAEHSIYRGT